MEQISEMPLSVSFPEDGCVFDYYLDLQTYRFDPWSKRKGRLMPRHSNYIPTPELSRVAYVAELYLSYGYNVMLVGERGSGKTSFTEVLYVLVHPAQILDENCFPSYYGIFISSPKYAFSIISYSI